MTQAIWSWISMRDWSSFKRGTSRAVFSVLNALSRAVLARMLSRLLLGLYRLRPFLGAFVFGFIVFVNLLSWFDETLRVLAVFPPLSENTPWNTGRLESYRSFSEHGTRRLRAAPSPCSIV